MTSKASWIVFVTFLSSSFSSLTFVVVLLLSLDLHFPDEVPDSLSELSVSKLEVEDDFDELSNSESDVSRFHPFRSFFLSFPLSFSLFLLKDLRSNWAEFS